MRYVRHGLVVLLLISICLLVNVILVKRHAPVLSTTGVRNTSEPAPAAWQAALERMGLSEETATTNMINVRSFGAKGDGVTDDTAVIKDAMKLGLTLYFPAGTYRITEELSLGPDTRNVAFVGSNKLTCLVSTRGDSCIEPASKTTILYDGPVRDDIAVIRASFKPVGTAPERTFNGIVTSLQVRNISVQANNKAGYGIYIVRSGPPHISVSNVTVSSARKDGIYTSHQFYGLFEHLVSSHNGRDGISVGRAEADFGWDHAYVNNTTWRDINASNNGGHGVNAVLHRANAFMRVTSSANKRANSFAHSQKPNNTNAADPFGTTLNARYIEEGGINVATLGAKGDGVTDSTAAIQAAIDQNKPIYFPPGKYRVTKELVVNADHQNVALLGTGTSFWSTVTQSGGPNWKSNGTETMLFYDGPDLPDGAVVRVADTPVGKEPARQVQNFKMYDIGINANRKAGYGLYLAWASNPLVSNISAYGATKDGIYISKQSGGRFEFLTARSNGGNGISAGRANMDFGWDVYLMYNTVFRAVESMANGSDQAFNEKTNPLHGYGFGLWLGTNNKIVGVTSESNDGTSFVIGASVGQENTFLNAYTEAASKTALSQGRTPRPYGIWINNSFGNRVNSLTLDTVFAMTTWKEENYPGEYILLTGSIPAGKVTLKNVYYGSGIVSNWPYSKIVLNNVHSLLNRDVKDTAISYPLPNGTTSVRKGEDVKITWKLRSSTPAGAQMRLDLLEPSGRYVGHITQPVWKPMWDPLHVDIYTWNVPSQIPTPNGPQNLAPGKYKIYMRIFHNGKQIEERHSGEFRIQ